MIVSWGKKPKVDLWYKDMKSQTLVCLSAHRRVHGLAILHIPTERVPKLSTGEAPTKKWFQILTLPQEALPNLWYKIKCLDVVQVVRAAWLHVLPNSCIVSRGQQYTTPLPILSSLRMGWVPLAWGWESCYKWCFSFEQKLKSCSLQSIHIHVALSFPLLPFLRVWFPVLASKVTFKHIETSI